MEHLLCLNAEVDSCLCQAVFWRLACRILHLKPCAGRQLDSQGHIYQNFILQGPSQEEIERKEACFLDASAAVQQDAEKMQECAGRIHALAFADSSFDRPTLEASEVTEQRLLLEVPSLISIPPIHKLQQKVTLHTVASPIVLARKCCGCLAEPRDVAFQEKTLRGAF